MKLKDPRFRDVENIIFDFGGVVADINVQRAVDNMVALGLTGFDPADIHPENTGIFLELELGAISNDDFFGALQEYAPSGTTPPSKERICDAWNSLISDFDMRRFELLDKVRGGYKVFLLSNTNLPHREHFIKKFNRDAPVGRDFESYFDGCYYSDAMRMRKPDPEIYREVVRRERLDAGRTLFVDDNSPNLTGAREAGLLTYHMAPGRTIFGMFE